MAYSGVDLDAIHRLMPVFIWSVTKQENYIGVAGTWTRAANANLWGNQYLGNTAPIAQNDAVCLGVVFISKAGSYTLHISHTKSAAYGKMHFLLNNVDKGIIDGYDAATTYNNQSSVSLGSLAVGLHALVIKMSDKHASSSDYTMMIAECAVIKT